MFCSFVKLDYNFILIVHHFLVVKQKMNADVKQDKAGVYRQMPVPTRVCQTCGVAKSLDHFVSMYTEASTTNCDECRKRQREVYRCINTYVC